MASIMLKKNSTAKRHSDKLVMPDGAVTAVKGTPVGVMYRSCHSVTHQSLRFTEWCYCLFANLCNGENPTLLTGDLREDERSCHPRC